MNSQHITPRSRDFIVTGIVFARGADGATISEIRSDYLQATQSECRPLQQNTDKCIDYLNRLAGLVEDHQPNEAHVWFAQCFHNSHAKSVNNVEGSRKVSADDGIGTGSSDTEANVVPSTQSTDPIPQIPTNNLNICVSNNEHSNHSEIPHEIPFQSVVRQIDREFESIPTIEISADPTNESTLDVDPIPIQGLSIHCDVNVER